ncbi:hypothetical protein [Gracilimonas mengyeensis]|uniref:Uncharacterized protein n=1 Tax=Gracilimonas mengyeensis TaxID=1302730 RepID=A0A521CVL9_9BACT|nr:hypothetical protein [Gracilimonas mengyeensis]SMO63497.1 hypothetical protein SAMN06265219_106134 [Gracilimonas mengyeensis]
MKEIILRIPDEKVDFVLELIEELGLEKADDLKIPEEHKEIIRNRIKTSNPEDLIPWAEAREQFKFKTKDNGF